MEFSQAELAEELGVRQQTISEWETGMYQPKRAMSKLLTMVAEQAGFRYGEGEKTGASSKA
jgi:DNA-binding transcriptional regulator YiaG